MQRIDFQFNKQSWRDWASVALILMGLSGAAAGFLKNDWLSNLFATTLIAPAPYPFATSSSGTFEVRFFDPVKGLTSVEILNNVWNRLEYPHRLIIAIYQPLFGVNFVSSPVGPVLRHTICANGLLARELDIPPTIKKFQFVRLSRPEGRTMSLSLLCP